MRKIPKHILLIVLLLAGCGVAFGQQYPERRHIRSGNRAYESQEFAKAERGYRQAQIIDTASVEAAFNLADAQYATEQFALAENTLSQLSKNGRLTPQQAAKTFYNLGNAQFQQQKLQEALESYKNSLRLDPDDMEAKYNFAYTKKLLDQNKDQNDQNQNDQNQDDKDDQNNEGGNDDKDRNQPPEKNGQDPDDGDKDPNQDRNGSDESQDPGDKPQPQQAPPEKKDVSPETEAMLQAVQQAEDKTREKVNEQKATAVGRSGKNW